MHLCVHAPAALWYSRNVVLSAEALILERFSLSYCGTNCTSASLDKYVCQMNECECKSNKNNALGLIHNT